MRIAVISANLGAYDQPAEWPVLDAPAGARVDVHRFTDENFPPRPLAMTSRLQAGIPKWWGWEMLPFHDVYIWLDASVTPAPQLVTWFLDHLGDREIAVFRHPDRLTIQHEYTFMSARMARPGEQYLNSRYRGEWLEEQYQYIFNRSGEHAPLFATTAFAYRPTQKVISVFMRTWGAKARWLLHDQLMFAYAMHMMQPNVTVIQDNYLQCEAFTFTRGRR